MNEPILIPFVVGVCKECGEPIFFGSAFKSDDESFVCADCAEDYDFCEECGRISRIDEMSATEDLKRVCEECISDHFDICFGCGQYVRDEDSHRIGEENFCSRCEPNWTECYECGGPVRVDNAYYTAGGNSICETCYDYDYNRCECCGEIYRSEDLNERGLCGGCAEDECNEPEDGVYGYHEFGSENYVARVCRGEKSGVLLYGVELEADEGNFDACDFEDWTDEIYRDSSLIHFEHDGSLSRAGVELITQPCSLKYHQKNMPWEKFTEILKRQGFVSHDCHSHMCGLHIHIGRDGLNPSTIVKMDVFINHADAFFKRMARRDNIYNGDYNTYKKAETRKAKRTWNDEERYSPVNTNNAETVEIRIFRGTLNHETILGSIELVDALVKFLDTIPIPRIYETKENLVKFIEFCGARGVEYPHLMRMMAQRSCVGDYFWAPNVRLAEKRANKDIEKFNKKGKGDEKCA